MGIVLRVVMLLWGMQAALGFVAVSPATTKAATATTSTTLAASTESEVGPNTHTRQGVNRKDALRRFGGVAFGLTTGAAWAGLGGAGATLSGAPGPSSAAAGGTVTRKSLQELQFEMLKKGLDLTHAFQYDEAEDVYTELIGLFDSDYAALSDGDKQLVAKAFSNRGNVRCSLTRVSGALMDYSMSIELSPTTAEYFTNRGLAFELLADSLLSDRESDAFQFYETAISDYDHALVLDPENHRLYLNAGDVLTRIRKNDVALEYYRRALVILPDSPATRGKVAMLEVENGNVARGVYMLETITRRNPDFAEMLLASAALDWTLGRFVDGIDYYREAIARDPRLLNSGYLEMDCHWPPTMLKMVGKLREAGTMEGIRSTAVSWFDSRGNLI